MGFSRHTDPRSPLGPAALTGILVLGSLAAFAGEPGADAPGPGAAPQAIAPPGAEATVRVLPAGEALRIDGRLDEKAWTQAVLGGDLKQYQPRAGEPMSEKTELRILHDRDNLYLGIRCHDREPHLITARGMERDGSVLSGDYVYFFFDTFNDNRNGYAFAVSPDEGRYDALVSNGFTVNQDWDGIWEVRCTRDGGGWTAEIKIPFKTVSFAPNSETWGFNFSRWIARKGEGGRWVDPRPEVQTSYAQNAGKLTGLRDISRGIGIQFSPYALGRSRRQKQFDSSFNSSYLNESEWDYGADLRYRITPSLNLTLSHNMDFAETEVDQRQINFTRFPLFFPEKRDFFLEDSGIYQVPGLGREVFLPYYSRRIGLVGGGDRGQQVIPIDYAAKLSGRVGQYDVGITAARLDGTWDGRAFTEEETVGVARLRRHFGRTSTVGFIGTMGDPNSTASNSLMGFDYRYQTSELFGDQTFVASVYAMQTRTHPQRPVFFRPRPDPFYGEAYGIALSYPNDTINFSIEAAEISDDFDPGLGFIERKGVRRYASNWRYLWRPEDPANFRWFSFIYANKIYTDLDNDLETGSHSFYPLVVMLGTDDEISFGVTNTVDKIDAGFAIPDSDPEYDGPMSNIPAGDYDMWNYEAKIKLSENRVFGGEFGVEWGDFYGGDWIKQFGNLYWIPEKHLALGANYERYSFDMPDAEIDTDLISAYITLRFNPRMRWSNYVQYDTLSDTVGLNSRFSWEVRPGQDLNLVFTQFYWNERARFEVLDTESVIKGDLTFRF